MNRINWVVVCCVSFFLFSCGGGDAPAPASPTPDRMTEIELGKLIFEDVRLSANGNQSCASCHDASAGFADPNASVAKPVSEGSIAGSFGNRNAPTSAYAGFSPVRGITKDSADNDVYVGGQFLDGRRDTLEEQARDPFLNMVEMANANKQSVVDKVKTAPYVNGFKQVFGEDVFDNTELAYNNIAHAIAAFERSPEMNKFNSKFDCYLQDKEKYPLDANEQAGLDVFDSQTAKCSICHTITPDVKLGKVLLTNFQHFNTGIPVNSANPSKEVDLGLGDVLVPKDRNEDGKFKTPTLRNIALTAPYMHNGVFATLKEVVEFYNIVDKESTEPLPEVINNITEDATPADILSEESINNIVSFMETLTDGTGVGICF